MLQKKSSFGEKMKMNKYLKEVENLNEKTNGNGYEFIIKMNIAIELESLCDNSDDEYLQKLTEDEQEFLIDLAYNVGVYDGNLTAYQCTTAVIKTLITDFNHNLNTFKGNYETNPTDVFDRIVYNII